MNSAGALSITAGFSGGRLAGIAVRMERPPAARLFVGREPAAVAAMAPRLYTLCAQAQGASARAALAAAAGEGEVGTDDAALWAEALHEHLWRLLLDWPAALGLPSAKEAFIAWRGERAPDRVVDATFALLERVLIGCPANDWERGEPPSASSLAGQCLARLAAAENVEQTGLPALTPEDWLAYWQGRRQSVPPTRRPESVAAAWRSRLTQTVQAARALAEGLPYPLAAVGEAGWGIGQTLTARGVLTHAVRLENGRVSAYRVWAPTDCHFADASALAALLADGRWPDPAAAKRGLEQAVLALDPCLPFTVEVDDA